ncbi:MAG: sensor histidine kinase [Alphaproteobacteria bacterium]
MDAPRSPIENLALVREANHRFANHLAVIVSAVNRQLSTLEHSDRDSLPRAEVRAMLEDLASSVYCIANLNRLIAQDPLSAEIDLEELLRLTTQNTISSFAIHGRMSLQCDFSGDLLVPHDKARAILLIVMEILMNAIKHARPNGGRMKVALQCRRRQDGGLVVEVADNGCGLPEGFDVERDGGTGFKVIRMLAHSLGKIEIDSSEAGLRFRLHVRPIGAKLN